MRDQAVHNIGGIVHFFQAALVRRVGMAMILDSNGSQLGTTGHFHGIREAIGTLFGLYSGAHWPGDPRSSIAGSGLGGEYAARYTDVAFAEFTVANPEPAEFTALRMPASSVLSGAEFPFGDIAWLGRLDSNFQSGELRAQSWVSGLDLNGKFALCAAIWRPASGGATEIAPSLHGRWDASRGLYVISHKTGTALPTRSASGIDLAKCEWARGEVIDFDNATNAANSAANFNGSGFNARINRWAQSTVSITNVSIANPSVITTSGAHGLRDKEKAVISGTNTSAAVNGTHSITLINSTQFSVPVNVTSVTTGTGTLTKASTALDGTLGLIAHWLEDTEKFHGFSVTPFYTYGGRPTRAAAYDICGIIAGTQGGMTDAAIGTWIDGQVIGQRDRYNNQLEPMLAIWILMGGNDAVDTGVLGGLAAGKSLLSPDGTYRSAVEETAVASNSRAGYFNNTITVMRRIRHVWESVKGYKRQNLCFIIAGYHPQTLANNSSQWTFVRTVMPTAFPDLVAADPYTCCIDGYRIGTNAEFGSTNGNTGTYAYTFNRPMRPVDGFNDRGDWATATAYAVGDIAFLTVASGGSPVESYVCKIAHTSAAAFNTDAANWNTLNTSARTAITAGHRSKGDQAHLNEPAYLFWGSRLVRALADAAIEAGMYGFAFARTWRTGRGV